MRLWPLRKLQPDMAGCREVMRELEAYLDGELKDELTVRRIAHHLEVCRDCGLGAQTLADLKRTLRQQAPSIDPRTLERLRAFARRLEDGKPAVRR